MENDHSKQDLGRSKVSTIVLNYNGRDLLATCLEDLLGQDYPNHDVIVVDNGSSDGSQFWLRGAHPAVTLVENHRNVGFAEGNNVGIRKALTDASTAYLVLLNNDTRLRPNWISALVDALELSPEFAGAQTPLVFENNHAMINSLGIAIERSLWAFDDGCFSTDLASVSQHEIFGVTCGAAIFRRGFVESSLDEGSFLEPSFGSYYEDVDLAMRARLKGEKFLLVPEPVVRHVASATGGRDVGKKVFLLERNHWFYVIRNVPLKTLLPRLPSFIWKRITRVMQWMWPFRPKVLVAAKLGNFAALFQLPTLIRFRRRNLRAGDPTALSAALGIRSGKEGKPDV